MSSDRQALLEAQAEVDGWLNRDALYEWAYRGVERREIALRDYSQARQRIAALGLVLPVPAGVFIGGIRIGGDDGASMASLGVVLILVFFAFVGLCCQWLAEARANCRKVFHETRQLPVWTSESPALDVKPAGGHVRHRWDGTRLE